MTGPGTRPRFADAHAELAIVAADIRDNRARADPDLVAAGKLDADEARDRLRIAVALAAHWRAVVDFAPLPDPAPDPVTAGAASQRELLAMLEQVTAGAARRAARAHDAMIVERAHFARMTREELWALTDANDPLSHRIRPYLHHESYAAACDALLWWQRRTGELSVRFLINTTLELRTAARAWKQAA